MAWTYRPDELASLLEAAGFDVDRAGEEGIGGGGSLTGRRERAERTILVALDAGGRLRLDVTARLSGGSAMAETVLGGVALRESGETIQTRTLTGTLTDSKDLSRVLDDLIGSASDQGAGTRPDAPANRPPPKQPPPSSGPW